MTEFPTLIWIVLAALGGVSLLATLHVLAREILVEMHLITVSNEVIRLRHEYEVRCALISHPHLFEDEPGEFDIIEEDDQPDAATDAAPDPVEAQPAAA